MKKYIKNFAVMFELTYIIFIVVDANINFFNWTEDHRHAFGASMIIMAIISFVFIIGETK